MIRLTLDANAYVSALEFGGRAQRLLWMAERGDIEIAASEAILDEVFRVLRQKFHWDGYRIHAECERLKSITKLVAPTKTVNVIEYDPPDNRILECAEAAESEYIISEDRDLLRLGTYVTSKIRRVADFFRELEPGRER